MSVPPALPCTSELSKTRARNVGRVCLERVMCEQKCGFPWMSPKLFHVTTSNHQHRSQTTQPDIFSNLNVNLNLQRISVAVNENEQHRGVEAAVLTQGDTSSAQGRALGTDCGAGAPAKRVAETGRPLAWSPRSPRTAGSARSSERRPQSRRRAAAQRSVPRRVSGPGRSRCEVRRARVRGQLAVFVQRTGLRPC